MAEPSCVIGKGISITGQITGEESLTVEGNIEGSIRLSDDLTVEPDAIVRADVDCEALSVGGELYGNIQSAKGVVVSGEGKLVGNIRAPRVVLEEGARYKGHIEMDVTLPTGVDAPT